MKGEMSMRLITVDCGPDVLFPARALLPLSAPGGGQRPLAHLPGPLRPLVASLGVAPLECGKHDTVGTRWIENKSTQKSRDDVVEPDTVPIEHTDT